jgi:hypothetical protein
MIVFVDGLYAGTLPPENPPPVDVDGTTPVQLLVIRFGVV